MKNRCIFPLLILLLFIGLSPVYGQGFVLQKDIYIDRDEVKDNVVSFGGTIVVEGEVKQNVFAFGGKIIIEGTVGELVLGIGSHIEIKSGAEVNGDVVCLGGILHKEEGHHIGGDTIYFELKDSDDLSSFFSEGLGGVFGLSLIPLILIIKLITIFIWFILAVVVVGIFPRQITYASSQIRSHFWPVFGTGILSIIIFSMMIIFAALLSLILIGIPILLALVIIGFIIKVFGRVILFYFFGGSLAKAFGNKTPSTLLSVILGFLTISFVGFIPILGSLFTLVLSIIGWGLVIRTKFGTRENWFAKK